MSSRQESLLNTASDTSPLPSISTLPNAFGVLMQSQASQPSIPTLLRDHCQRPPVDYNQNYNPYSAPPTNLPPGYSLYVFELSRTRYGL